jgi:hypothetical protein
MQTINRDKIKEFIQESVEWLQKEQIGCCRYKLDDHLAIFVGWSAGYGEEKRDDVIQAKDYPDYGINAGVKVWTSDDIWTDYDYLNFPYREDGEVYDMGMGIAPNDNYEDVVQTLIDWYCEARAFTLADDGKILRETMWVCEHCLMAIESREGNQATMKHYVDEDDDVESKCDWCEEVGFNTLYELV